MKKVLIKWLTEGAISTSEGLFRRFKGDQDMMGYSQARKLEACKMLVIIGNVNEIQTIGENNDR
ncbi:MAG: hypothetical protein DRQ46_00285 [Gammaproteobacteria bacterium]|nr:MAG: hypothetical protein DRQ46_00285 [Gammaproteobacteria bacterium]